MVDYKKIAEYHAKMRKGKLIKTNKGLYYFDQGENEPSEFHENYEEYVKDMWARNHKPYKFLKK